MRSALDAGEPRLALTLLDRELNVKGNDALPSRKNMRGDDALLVLDRATVQQSLVQLAGSRRDYEAADKALDALDLSHGGADEVGKWLFSDSAGRYAAPPHEKLMINVLNMVNYLEMHDLSGARVEARRLGVTARYLRDWQSPTRDGTDNAGRATKSPALALGSLLAGFTYERSGEADEARRYYDDAIPLESGAFTEPSMTAQGAAGGAGTGELLVVVGWGRVAHRVANRVPVGLALTRAAPYLEPDDQHDAAKLAAQGLVTWVSFPSLAHESPLHAAPRILVDGRTVELDATLDVAAEVRAQWARIEGAVMAAAVTRSVARVLLGKAVESIANTSEKKEVRAVGLLVSLFAQVALSAADTPDTRSWETMPARLGIARVRVPPGSHQIVMEARGYRREGHVSIARDGWAATSLFALR
jgi:uncharacterized protein